MNEQLEKEIKEFIINELDELASSFPCARFRYEYDELADVHVVEANPNELYHNNNKYIAREKDLTDRFIELFPDQNICFIPDDDIVGISRVDYEISGCENKS